MRMYLLAAVAAVITAAPAAAQDARSGPYVGLEGGLLFPESSHVDGAVTYGSTVISRRDAFRINYNDGFDVDGIVGYDFGMFRLEGELGYKRAGIKSVVINPTVLADYNTATGDTLTASDFDARGHASVVSGMLNGMVDFNLGALGAYAGAGIGLAHVTLSDDTSGGNDNSSDDALAYQLVAGLRAPVTPSLDVGLKYRYFRTDTLKFSDTFATDAGPVTFGLNGHFSSHSLLASLIYNFGAAASAPIVPAVAPPPPQVVAPANQTCPDGTVILATEVCPAPPPPPPPPPPPGERG